MNIWDSENKQKESIIKYIFRRFKEKDSCYRMRHVQKLLNG